MTISIEKNCHELDFRKAYPSLLNVKAVQIAVTKSTTPISTIFQGATPKTASIEEAEKNQILPFQEMSKKCLSSALAELM